MTSRPSNEERLSIIAAGKAVRDLISHGREGALSTLLPENGAPYASLVSFAAGDAGEPVLFLSKLAWHTKNILADERACLLIRGEREGNEGLAAPRASLMGKLRPADRNRVQDAYFRVHPDARLYGKFADFSFYGLNVEGAHYVAGFGQIVTLDRAQLFTQAFEK